MLCSSIFIRTITLAFLFLFAQKNSKMEPILICIFSFSGINHLIIFLYKREWFDDTSISRILFIIYAFMFLFGVALTYSDLNTITDSFLILKMPLLSLSIYKLMQFCFVKLFGYKPRDSFWTSNVRLMKDGLFNFAYWILGLIIPAVLIFGRHV